MLTSIKRWGNSKAVRLPKKILDIVELNENDQVELRVENGYVVIVPVNNKHKPLKERIAEYAGDYVCEEWDTGEPTGREVL